MDRSELAAAHDANFIATLNLLADVADAGFRRSFGTVQLAASRVPAAFFNAIFLTEPLAGRLDALRQAVDLMRTEQVPFVVHVQTDRPEDVEAARSLGLEADGVLPCFAMEPRDVPAPPAELSIARVD